MAKIVFFHKESGSVLQQTGNLFVMDGIVYRHTYDTFESQCSVVSFDTFVEELPDIDWRVSE